MRRFFVAVALTSMLAVAFVVAGASAASAATMPAEGVFENCPLNTAMPTCLQRLEAMHQGGVNVVVIGAAGSSLASLSTYANAAHSLGMSVMWELSNPDWWSGPSTSTELSDYYSSFTTACECTQKTALLAHVVHWLGSLPGTYGYYAADDEVLAPGGQAAIASYIAEIKQQDPVHTVMIATWNDSQTATYQRMADVLGQEIYPVMNQPLVPINANQDTWGPLGDLISQDQQSATKAGKQSAFILQAFSWGDNLDDGQATGVCTPNDTKDSCYAKLLYPSAAAQLQLRNEVLLHAHPQLILWWSFMGTYGQADTDTYSIYPTGAVAAARWAGLSAAIQAPYPSSGASPSGAPKAQAANARTPNRTHQRRTRRRHRLHTRRHARRHGAPHRRRHNGGLRHRRLHHRPRFLAHAA